GASHLDHYRLRGRRAKPWRPLSPALFEDERDTNPEGRWRDYRRAKRVRATPDVEGCLNQIIGVESLMGRGEGNHTSFGVDDPAVAPEAKAGAIEELDEDTLLANRVAEQADTARLVGNVVDGNALCLRSCRQQLTLDAIVERPVADRFNVSHQRGHAGDDHRVAPENLHASECSGRQ